MTIAERFNKHWTPVPEAGCWLWTASTFKSGYGQLAAPKLGLPPLRAHRVSWEMHRGEIPTGLMICHKCDTPSCVNPDHLFVGTMRDNMRDASHKNRIRGSWQRRLTDEDIDEIRRLFVPGRKSETNLTSLAKKFGVSRPAISAVVAGRVATFPPSPSAASTPLSLVAGGLEPDYASEQYPQDPIPSYADRRGI